MATNSGYYPAAGTQSAGKYPRVGPNYQKYGEQPGWTYSPRDDKYYRDKQSQDNLTQYEIDQGLRSKPPSQPGLGQTILPIAATLGTIEVARQAGKDTAEGLRGLYKDTPTVVDATGATVTAPTAPTAGATQGLLSAAKPAVIAPAPQGTATIAPVPDSFNAMVVDPSLEVPGVVRVGGNNTADAYLAADTPTPELLGGETPGLTAGNAIQGLGGAYTAYQGAQDLKNGNPVGGLIGIGSGGILAGNALANSGFIGGGQTLGALAPYAGGIAGAYGAYTTSKMIGDSPMGGRRNINGTLGGAASGAAIGTAILPGAGTAIGAGIGALAGLAGSYFGSSKDKYQMIRDKGREALVKAGILKQNESGHQLGTLADGSEYDFSKDGKTFGKPNLENPNFGKAAAYGNVISTLEGMYGRPREAMATMYSNAGLSNSGDDLNKLKANFQHFATQRGLTLPAAQAQLDQMLASKQITQNEHDVYLNDAREILQPPVQNKPGLLAAAGTPTSGPTNVNVTGGLLPKSLPPPVPQRSQTDSPGMKNGRPVNYGLLGAAR